MKTNEEIQRDKKAFKLKQLREIALKGSDWTQMPDSPLSDEEKKSWAEYRQLLRDITKDPSFPDMNLPRRIVNE